MHQKYGHLAGALAGLIAPGGGRLRARVTGRKGSPPGVPGGSLSHECQ